jgi:hypothetical protein
MRPCPDARSEIRLPGSGWSAGSNSKRVSSQGNPVFRSYASPALTGGRSGTSVGFYAIPFGEV